MNSKFGKSPGWLVALVLIGAAAVAAWMYRGEIEHWASGLNAESAEPQSATPSDGVVRIEVGESGFTPETVSVMTGETQTLEFTRTVERTCITAVVFPSTGERFDLPIGQPVRVPVMVKPGESVAFTCPMEMFHGKVVASKTMAGSTEADAITRIEITAEGFSPESVVVAPGGERVIEFTRKVENSCISAVVFPATGARHELPLDTPVRVTIPIAAGERIAFTCPMDMYHGEVVASDSGSAAAVHDHDEIAYWTCSMHPSVRSSTPGTCPICSMDLVSVTRGEVETGVILVDAQRRQLIGVTTDTVARRELSGELRMVGRVVVDETRFAEVALRYDAWIGDVLADFTGKAVRKGEPMFTFYNPQLWSLQEEYLEATRRGTELAGAAETRLRLWGIDSAQIEDLRKRGKALEYLTINAPISGTVLEKHIVPGSAVEAGMALYRIADLSTVWIEADVNERDVQRIGVGQRARIALEGIPDADINGSVSYIYPDLNPETRTGRVRFAVPNAEGRLKLDMYADVYADLPFGERLSVPVGAVIYAGASHVVFVDLGEGRLEPRRVKIGVRAGELIEVLEGVQEGETVVTSANFLIAAESKLKSGIEKW